jgi:xanthine dehydrogenase YagS FAD-binding subunit
VNPFAYQRAESVADAINLHARNPASRFLGGGTNLIDLMKYGVERPDTLIDVTRLPLTRIEPIAGGGLRIGALVRNSDLAADRAVVSGYPVLSEAILHGASPQLRNMATTGGNLMQRTRCYYFYDTAFPCNKREPGSGCSAIGGHNRIHAVLGQSESCIAVNPSDMSVALAALDAVVRVEGPRGPRTIPIVDFHRLPGESPQIDTNLQRDELITAVDLPASPVAARSHYIKVRDRASYAFALVSAAVAFDAQDGTIRSARIALGGVAHKPWRAAEAERSLAGQRANEESFRRAAELALTGARGYEHNTFKIELAKRTIVRALVELNERRT